MSQEEIRSTIEQIKAQVKAKPENKGKTEDEIDEIILDGFLKSFDEGKIQKEDLGAIAEAMGYELTDEFEESTEEGGIEGVAKEDLMDARDIKEGESKEEFKEKIESLKGEDGIEAETEAEEGEEDDEEDERKKASELWKMNLSK